MISIGNSLWGNASVGGGGGEAPIGPPDSGNLAVFLRWDEGVTVNGSNRLTAWADQSGAGNHVTTFSGTAPILVPVGGNAATGVDFDSHFRSASRATLVGGTYGDCTVYVVSKWDDQSGVQTVCQSAGGFGQVQTVGAVFRLYDGTILDHTDANGSTAWNSYTALFDVDDNDSLYQGGTLLMSGNSGNSGTARNGYLLGAAGTGIDGLVKAYMLYPGVLHGPTTRAAVLSYLATEFPTS